MCVVKSVEVVVVYFKMLTEQLHRLFETSHETFHVHNHKRRSNVVWALRDFRPPRWWNATQRRLVVNDVSGQHIGPTFKGSLKVGPKVCPETSVTNYQPAVRNIPDHQRSRRADTCYALCAGQP